MKFHITVAAHKPKAQLALRLHSIVMARAEEIEQQQACPQQGNVVGIFNKSSLDFEDRGFHGTPKKT